MTPPAKPILSHNLSRCHDTAELDWHDATRYWPGADAGKILRMLDDGSVRSAIVRMPDGSQNPGAPVCAATVQGYILSGGISLDDRDVGPGGFFAIPTGQTMPVIRSVAETEMVLILDDAKSAKLVGRNPVIIADTMAVEPIIPEIDGVPMEGIERRVLWEDPNTGADTRLLTLPPAFEGRGANWHPVHEEIFCLAGDTRPDDSRLMTKGWYLHNPAYGIHGYHEHSTTGAKLLEWHDGRWSVNFVSDS